MQKNWIGRSEGLRSAGVYSGRPTATPTWRSSPPVRTPFWRVLHGDRRRSSDWQGAGGAKSGAAEFCDRMPPRRHFEAAIETAEKKGSTPVIRVVKHPLDPDLDAAGLCRQFRADGLRHRRHLRLPGRRPARPGFCPQVQYGLPVKPVVMPNGCRSGDLRNHRRGLCR
jgi:hypothetical protein